jgi:hypothetical protein
VKLAKSTRARLTTALVLILVMGAGAVLGVAIDRQLVGRALAGEVGTTSGSRSGGDPRSRGFDSRYRDPGRAPAQMGDSAQRRPLIVEQVGLSDLQRVQIDSILRFYRNEMRALHDEFDQAYSTRYREITQATRDAIKGILTDEQRFAYDSLLVAWDRRREERRRDSISEPSDPGNRP